MAAKPEWLRVRIAQGPDYQRLRNTIHGQGLHTVCEEALCPNIGNCWNHGRATLMILGGVCTRHCRFCNVTPGTPPACDAEEPSRCAEVVASMGLKDVVLTSVTRDDLPDGGGALWAETIRRVRERTPGILIEVLVPDFGGSREGLDAVLTARPDVFGHNLETVPSLYERVRPEAEYGRSLDVLMQAHNAGLTTKTGLMVGLGENREEILAVMKDAREAGVEILYIGQYLQPTRDHAPVHRYVEPAEFDEYRECGVRIGFPVVVSSPLVRSSYHTEEQAAYLKKRMSS